MSMLSVGAPPRFDWHKWDLVQFDALRGLLSNKPYGGKPVRVSVLAVIVDIRPMREVGRGKYVAEWDLADPTGQNVRFSLWGSGGDELSSLVRREDVVWIGGEGFRTPEAASASVYRSCADFAPSDASRKQTASCPSTKDIFNSLPTTIPGRRRRKAGDCKSAGEGTPLRRKTISIASTKASEIKASPKSTKC
jgi:hypothetical protein